MATKNYPFSTPSNYTYNTDLIEVTGTVAQLKDKTPASATFGATYTADENGNWGDGVLTGTLAGGASVSGGQLDLTGGVSAYAYYDALDNADLVQTGCIRTRVKFNYSGNSPSAYNFVNISGAGLANLIEIFHSTANIWARYYDSASAQIDAGLQLFSPVAGTTYEFELNFDATLGIFTFYINGTRIFNKTGTGSRSSAITSLKIGANRTGGGNNNVWIEDLIIFDAVQHTGASYVTGETIPETRYSLANPSITTNLQFIATDITAMTTTITETGSDAVKHTVVASGQDRYVTGGSAADSNGTYPESSTLAELQSDITNVISARKKCTLKTFLHSDDGSSTPNIDIATFTYDEAADDPTTATLTDLEGWDYTHSSSRPNQEIKVRPYEAGFINEHIFHQYEWNTLGNTDADGHFFGEIYVQPTGKFWEIKIGAQSYTMQLDDQNENKLWDLTLEAVE